jgi:hypothetical protein
VTGDKNQIVIFHRAKLAHYARASFFSYSGFPKLAESS